MKDRAKDHSSRLRDQAPAAMKAFYFALIVLPLPLDAQYWRGIGRGVQVHGWVQLLYGDSVLDRLIGAGPFPDIFNENDSVEATGIAAWNGQRWDSLGHRLPLICA